VDNRRECFETAGDSDIEDSQKILKMTQEEFLLKWNDHHASFFTIVEDLCRTEQLCDVTLACGGQVFETHKLILSVCSPYFRTLLNSRPDKHPIVYLKDVNPKHLEQLLSYMYRGEINVLQEDLGPLIETARGLQIKGLADAGNSDNSSNSKPKPTHNGLPSHPLPQLTQPKRPRTTTPTSIPKMARIEAPRLPQVPLPGLSPSNLHDEGGESIVEVDPTQGAVKQEMWMMGSGGDSNDGEENDGMESNIPHESYEQDMQAEDEQYIHAGSEGLTGQQQLALLKKEFQKKYPCEFCHKRFPTPSKLQRHQLVHSGEKPYLCFICLKGFTQRVHLNTHKKHAHPNHGTPGMNNMTGNMTPEPEQNEQNNSLEGPDPDHLDHEESMLAIAEH